MAYNVNLSNGVQIATVLDGQTDSLTTSISLIGRQVVNYGEIQNENFVHILENFSNSIEPIAPLEGQLWWNSTYNTMLAYDGTFWRPVSGFTSATTAPLSPYIGDQWWDTTNDQYKVYNGTDWSVVGPAYSKLDGKSGAIVESVWDTGLTKHTVIKLYHNNSVTGIISRDATFTPNAAISGFSTIAPGITLASNISDIRFYGTASNSELLGNLAPTQFLRSDVNDVMDGKLSIHNTLEVGSNDEFKVSVDGSGNATLLNNKNNANVLLRANVAGVLTTALTINGTSGLITVVGAPSASTGIATKGYVDGIDTSIRNSYSTFIASNIAAVNSNLTITNNNLTAANAAIASLDSLKAPKANPELTGVPTAPTANYGTATNQIATTAFVQNEISIFDTTKIYNSNSKVEVGTHNISLVVDSTIIGNVTSSGINVSTQSAGNNSTLIATTAFVNTATKNFVKANVAYKPTCYVSDAPPDDGIGNEGDFWFQYL
jgi:hypothetical protein